MTNLPRGHRISALFVAVMSLCLSVVSLAHTGCSAQTAAEYGPFAEAAMAFGCNLVDVAPSALTSVDPALASSPAASALSVGAPVLASACKGFEPMVGAAVAKAQAEVAASTGASVADVKTRAAKEPRVALRKRVNGKLTLAGFCPCSLAASAQKNLDPSVPAPEVAPSVSSPSASMSAAPASSVPAPAPASSAGK